jgi:hypothetical protein
VVHWGRLPFHSQPVPRGVEAIAVGHSVGEAHVEQADIGIADIVAAAVSIAEQATVGMVAGIVAVLVVGLGCTCLGWTAVVFV